MLISDLELFVIDLPQGGNFSRSLLIHLLADSGEEGWGETRLSWRPAELPVRRRMLLSVLAGRSVYDIEPLLGLDLLADHALACGLDMALWDMIARRAGEPLCHLLGGCYRREIPCTPRLHEGSVDDIAAQAQALVAQSLGSLTVLAQGRLEADTRLMATVREAVGERVHLRLDAGGRYDARDAMRLIANIEPSAPQFVVDPLAAGRTEQLAMLSAHRRVPLAFCAGLHGPSDVARLSRLDAAQFFLVDPIRVGGLTRARQCATVADAAGVMAGMRIEGTSGLALAATLHLAAATPGFSSGHECTLGQQHADILDEPLRLVDGMFIVPSTAGLGVEPNRDKLDEFAARS